jgi:hypothetical protein
MSSNSSYNISNESPNESPIQLPPQLAQTPAPLTLSPSTIETTLHTQLDLNATLLHSITNGLLQTITNCEADTTITNKAYEDRLHGLEQCILHYKDTFNMPPEGFGLNAGQITNSTSLSVMGSTKNPSGYVSMTMGLCQGTVPHRGLTSSPTSLTSTLRPIPALTHPSNLYQPGFATCLPAPAATSKSFKQQWPTPMTGDWLMRSQDCKTLMTTSWPWWLSSRDTNMTLMLHEQASCLVSPISCLPVPQNVSSHSITWPGNPEWYIQGGRGLTMGYRVPMYKGIHCREGLMTLALGQHLS